MSHVVDMLRATRANELVHVGDAMREPLLVPEALPLSRLLDEMKKRHTHLVVVLDEFGSTLGIVTLHDVVASSSAMSPTSIRFRPASSDSTGGTGSRARCTAASSCAARVFRSPTGTTTRSLASGSRFIRKDATRCTRPMSQLHA